MNKQFKTYWSLLSLVFIVLISSCTDTDAEFKATYIYKNNTEENVDFILMGDIMEDESIIDDKIKKYVIMPLDSIVFEILLPTNEEITEMPTDILKWNNLLGDSLNVVFDTEKSFIFSKNVIGKDSIYIEENYSYEQTEAFAVTFKFTLD